MEDGGESILRSGSAVVPSKLRFFNCTRRSVDIIWINHEGHGVRFRTFEPDKFVDIDTYVGHPWIFRDHKTNERMVVNSEKTYMPPDTSGRTHVNITIPMLSLTDLSLQVLRRFIPNGAADQLHLPWLIKQELTKSVTEPEMTVVKNLTEYVTERRNARMNEFMRYFNPHLNWLNNPFPRTGLRLLRVHRSPTGRGGDAASPAANSHSQENPDTTDGAARCLSDSHQVGGGDTTSTSTGASTSEEEERSSPAECSTSSVECSTSSAECSISAECSTSSAECSKSPAECSTSEAGSQQERHEATYSSEPHPANDDHSSEQHHSLDHKDLTIADFLGSDDEWEN